MTQPSWDDLTKKKQHEAPSDEYAELCALVFSTGSGKRLLELLHVRYVDAAHHETSLESTLRAAEAKRFLVRELEVLTAKGLALSTKQTKATKREVS